MANGKPEPEGASRSGARGSITIPPFAPNLALAFMRQKRLRTLCQPLGRDRIEEAEARLPAIAVVPSRPVLSNTASETEGTSPPRRRAKRLKR